MCEYECDTRQGSCENEEVGLLVGNSSVCQTFPDRDLLVQKTTSILAPKGLYTLDLGLAPKKRGKLKENTLLKGFKPCNEIGSSKSSTLAN